VDVLSVAVYGWVIFGLEWPRVVRSGLGLGDPVILDDAVILLPFLLAQLAGWWGVYAAERALRPARGPVGLGRYLALKARQSLGMVLPVAAVYGLGSDLVRRRWPGVAASPWEQPVSLALMGLFVLALAPAFVRLAWPTRPLPPGPLRDRLEHLARRLGFRCTDILVWDTNQVVVNAGVTGSLPWYRYVLLTDALVEHLGPHEIAAVFGHEIGHIAHRHLLYFGFFIVASVGVLALGAVPAQRLLPEPLAWLAGDSATAFVAQASAALLVVGAYFLVIFGFVSRRFERQADVFGCHAVSCGRPDCPPHADLDGHPDPTPAAPAAALCPVGIRIFINALTSVAMLNGMRPGAWSWRHGSIVRRVAFLESLVGRPEAERRFQRDVRRMRRVTAAVLLAAVAALAAVTSYSR
jgi:STE24 endopeptidase